MRCGVASGLADDGGLRVRMPNGEVRSVHAGEVKAIRAMSGNPGDWLFDLGNITRLKCAPLVDGRCGEVVALAHGEAGFADRLDALLPRRGGVAHVASVAAGERSVDLLERLASRFARIDIARRQAACAGVRIAYATRRSSAWTGSSRCSPHETQAARRWWSASAPRRPSTWSTPAADTTGADRAVAIVDARSAAQRAPVLPGEGGTRMDFRRRHRRCAGLRLRKIARGLAAARERLGLAPTLLLHGGGARRPR